MAEKVIFAYFRTMEGAEKAVKELKNRGFHDARIDRFSPIGGGNVHDVDDILENPFTNQGISLTTSTLGSPELNPDKRTLLAAHEDASGWTGGHGFSSPEDVCVTVFIDPARLEEVTSLLELAGARL
ncbi:hypothetical protein ACFO25_02205 [Paenactinomyces guangxiensis]|uniref:Uncharacterized protein n=1 Tax=Paenactinomyces guangxiensis TaxID=1490290 RepID=A0A7W1WS27_9BACL|nr:hypothetical protein [Paenactinomyces guangxiensis]MBA4495042.1 hypothetical protein [Paenactinomyces guangxiensis]MBH8592126.1 hypothetical protein [Paenactinomyces guangxiensis]